MDCHTFNHFADDLARNGTILLTGEDRFFTDRELEELEAIAESLPREFVAIGDAGEPNSLEVSRFMTDVDRPRIVNEEISKRGIQIVSQPNKQEYYRRLLKTDSELFIRRMQYNILGSGSFVGYHLDTDSNPDYLVAVVLQFGCNFSGGDYVVYGGDLPPRSFSPTNRSIIVSHCHFPHEVTKVKSGKRKSLVYFLSENEGVNRRVSGSGIYENKEAER